MKNNSSFQLSLDTFYEIFNDGKFLQIFSSLSIIILLILILTWILKKISYFKINNIMSCMKILDRLSIGPNESIILVKIQDIQLILGVTNKNITHLYTFSSIMKKTSLHDETVSFLKDTPKKNG